MIQFKVTKKFFNIFTKQEKLLFFFLIFSQLIAGSLEIISIGSLLPVFKSITDPKWNEAYFGFLSELVIGTNVDLSDIEKGSCFNFPVFLSREPISLYLAIGLSARKLYTN